jgi:hypothetical protein
MKKLVNKATVLALSLLPASVMAYTAPPVEIKDPNSTDVKMILNSVIEWILVLVGGIAVLFLVWGGIQYVTSAGNKDKAELAKKTITYAVIGIIIIVLAEVIVNIATGLPTNVGITN